MDIHASWERAWSGIGAHSNAKSVFERLIARYEKRHRKYHSLQHPEECPTGFEASRSLAMRPAEVETGLWFHDAIYDTARHDNEELSAGWARNELLGAGAPPEAADRVQCLISMTKHTAVPTLADQQLLVDIDLGILGASAQRFAEYEGQIREEYSFVPGPVFRSKRAAILQTFLDRPHIYSTEHFHSTLEEKARANLLSAISANFSRHIA